MRMSFFVAAILPLLGSAELVGQSTTEEPSRAPPRCDYGEPHAAAPPELAEFSFLVGDFEITSHAWTGSGWTPPRPGPRARWNGWYGLGGMAIYDEWFDPDPGLDPNAPRGVNVRYYDADQSQWQMMWIATGVGQVADLRAELRDGKLTMWQVYPDRPGFLADFTVEDPDHWHRVSYTKNDKDEWTPQFKLAATRIPCQ
ncbi:MAG: hypothetical protein ACR2QM_05245 [Longimicrobiales bacterium]